MISFTVPLLTAALASLSALARRHSVFAQRKEEASGYAKKEAVQVRLTPGNSEAEARILKNGKFYRKILRDKILRYLRILSLQRF